MGDSTIGRYRLEEEIGSGGMGVVYRASDPQLQRTVAVKLIARSLAGDPASRDRLLHEARAASALNHPNICTVYEVGEAQGAPFLVMEFVEGRPLSTAIPQGGLPPETVVRYGIQIADALAHAHARGVIHRDLKSANIVVTTDGRAKVLDFGLAERLKPAELSDLTQSQASIGGVAGTLHYIAPEVLRGGRADARSDIWALGVLLHELAGGQLPFQGHTGFELTASILREPPRPLPPAAGAGLRGVIQRCLHKEPDHRYQHAGEVRAALEAIQPHQAVLPPAAPSPRRMAGRVGLVAALAAVLVASSWALFMQRSGVDSIAVLPFANVSGEQSAQLLTMGLSETLINNFSKLPDVRVVPRSISSRYSGKDADAQQAGKELGVAAVLTGRVLVRDGRVNVQAELVDVRRGSQFWGQQYEGSVGELLGIQEAIAREVGARLRGGGSDERRTRAARRPTANPAAYEAYLLGQSNWSRRKEDSNDLAIKYFTEAIRLDPEYALAYAGLANAYSIEGYYNWDRPSETFGKARGVAQRAVELDPDAAESHFALAFAKLNYDFDIKTSTAGFRRALEISPNNASIRFWRSLLFLAESQPDAAVSEARQALEIDPFWQLTSGGLAWAQYHTRRYDEAIAQATKTVEMEPNWVLPHGILGAAYTQKGDYTRAIAAFEKSIETASPITLMTPALGYTLARAGRRAEAEKFLAELDALAAKRYVPAYYIATTYAGLGDPQRAMEWLERAYRDRSHWLLYLKTDPMLDEVREHQGFQDLVKRVGLI